MFFLKTKKKLFTKHFELAKVPFRQNGVNNGLLECARAN